MKSLFPNLEKLSGYLPDKLFLRLLYYRRLHQLLHLRRPLTIGDYIQWIKLNGKLERFSQYVDKYVVRAYVEHTIGAEYLIPMLGVWDSFDEITFEQLPQRFVLKATHGSGYNYICKDKSTIDMEAVRVQANSWLAENFYRREREPQYRDCTPRLIAEQYVENETGQLPDYKVHCSKGEPKIIQVNSNRFSGNMSEELFDPSWQRLSTVHNSLSIDPEKTTPKPRELAQMLKVARNLSKEFPYVRVDLYVVHGRVYFGELTFTPGSGFVTFMPKATGSQEFVRLLGIDLSAYA
jgi:hypothetical protein